MYTVRMNCTSWDDFHLSSRDTLTVREPVRVSYLGVRLCTSM